MSRYYKMEVDVDPKTPAELLSEEGMEVDGYAEGDECLIVYGHMTLSGGEGPDEAHARIAKALGQTINSRWLNMDMVEWDHQIDDREEE